MDFDKEILKSMLNNIFLIINNLIAFGLTIIMIVLYVIRPILSPLLAILSTILTWKMY